MSTHTEQPIEQRTPLTRERVLRAAVQLADEGGLEAVSMRKVGQVLGVEAMSLYNHVANKDEMLDGMVELVVGEIGLVSAEGDWKKAMRSQLLAARAVMLDHKWAPEVIETRTTMSPPLMRYMDTIIGVLRQGGLSIELAHHAMHVLGSRLLGFNQELFDDSDTPEASSAEDLAEQLAAEYPHISAIVASVTHDSETIVGSGCDDSIEFVFGLDLILDGLERLRDDS